VRVCCGSVVRVCSAVSSGASCEGNPVPVAWEKGAGEGVAAAWRQARTNAAKPVSILGYKDPVVADRTVATEGGGGVVSRQNRTARHRQP